MLTPRTPFPTLDAESPEHWQWPSPPLAWPHVPAPIGAVPLRCAIEGPSGERVRAEVLAFEPRAQKVTLRADARGSPGLLAFASFRRLTLVEPLRATPPMDGDVGARIPTARKERDYQLFGRDDGQTPVMTGRTVGHVETAAGLYLFTPVEEEAALQRVFVPRWAYSHCEFGRSAEEIAATLWIGSPQDLREALERQQRMPVLPIGQSLLALGLLTREQLDRELSRSGGDMPLGEALVARGLISKVDLQTAIAHKMGYPMVDLARFPIDRDAVTLIPRDIAVRHRLLPLMVDQGRLIVAVDRPSRVTDLQGMRVRTRMPLVPVLASAMRISTTLDALSLDMWSQQVVGRPAAVEAAD